MNAIRERRQMRQYAEEQNRQYGKVLEEIPPHLWPESRPDGIERVFRSRDFLVQVYAKEYGVRRLSINRMGLPKLGRMGDAAPIRNFADGITWDELQRLKHEAGYGDQDAVEVYPADADVVNVANLRHLWVLDVPLSFAWRPKGEGE